MAETRKFRFNPDVPKYFGELPRQGSLGDVLACAGTNELTWMTLMRENPRNPAAHEAKRKAGFYAGVALTVFGVDSIEVIDAIGAVSKMERSEVVRQAGRCREAPQNWRE